MNFGVLGPPLASAKKKSSHYLGIFDRLAVLGAPDAVFLAPAHDSLRVAYHHRDQVSVVGVAVDPNLGNVPGLAEDGLQFWTGQ